MLVERTDNSFWETLFMKFTKGVHGTDGLASWQDQSKEAAVRLKPPLIPPCACTVHVLRMPGGCLGAARYVRHGFRDGRSRQSRIVSLKYTSICN